MSFKQWADMSDEEREAEAQAVSVLFIGLPGVVGAPLVMGPDYWVDVARHLVECGVRLVADSIKHYEPGTAWRRRRLRGSGVTTRMSRMKRMSSGSPGWLMRSIRTIWRRWRR
ncbi:phage gene 29 protein family protein [Gordonia westfalica]|uniref:phage gene 29 protein family protein n=1 Tax=Gordonia westfalica TaxID=158898 RepID=UPI00111332F6|nr:DUF2744 domain-containing protein [Gordonia westfalica]